MRFSLATLAQIASMTMLATCGGKAPPSSSPTAPPEPGAKASDAAIADAGMPLDAEADTPLVESIDCSSLVEHIFKLAYQSQRKQAPETRPNDADLVKAKESAMAGMLEECTQSPPSAEEYRCALGATTSEELRQCVSQK